MPQFVHLHVRSEYSLVDSIARIQPMLQHCAELNMPAMALTDHSNLFATVKFYKAARAQGVKPIIGCDLWVKQTADAEPFLLTFLAMNDVGYKNIIELISLAYTKGQDQTQLFVLQAWVEENSAGIICLSGASSGELGQLLINDKENSAAVYLKKMMALFEDRFYIELQRLGKENENLYTDKAVALATKVNCPIVATNDVRFLKDTEFEAHEARVCIQRGDTLDDPRRLKQYSQQQYFRSQEEMKEVFKDLPEALENTIEIAKRCNLELTLGKSFLPEFPIPEGLTEAEFFRKISEEGLQQRLLKILDKGSSDYSEQLQEYSKRLDFELNIITDMGFTGYFLIVMDFIQWAKQEDIPVGPGRGSGAGSLVAYALKITDLDPLEYDLLFERFLNPERISMPDFDIDFCMDNRDRVIQYVSETYGREAVSQIVTFGTMAAKAVVRDVARVQGKSYGLADRLSKMIPFDVGITLDTAFKQEESIRQFLDEDSEAQEIWDMAIQLEGVVRNCGKHAGGVVIAPTKLTDFAPLYCDIHGEGLVTQYDKDDVESVGLVKFDFLGLKTLTIIDWALDMVNKKRALTGESPISIEAIDLADQATYKLLQRAETTAVFQLESPGMRDLIKRQLPDRFEDIVALVALFRPGPLQSGMVDDFINRKRGKEKVSFPHPTYQHEELEPVLKSTYGIILYQEQVMKIAQVIGQFSLGEADLLRRAMGKKKPEEMAKIRKQFITGAQDRNVEEGLASNLFDLMEKFAGYGFNKSHSAAYALVAYQTAWLKVHYPAEFMAAVLTADMQNSDKIDTFVNECAAMSLVLTAPDANGGDFSFSVNAEGKIIYGLGAIKGLGAGAIESIVNIRKEQGDYRDIFDFCLRVDLKKVNKRSLEALVMAGALDSIAPESKNLGESRAQLMASLPDAVKVAEQQQQTASTGIEDMFGGLVNPKADFDQSMVTKKRQVFPWSNKDLLHREKETLGRYLSGHPIDDYRHELMETTGKRIVELKASRSKVWSGGLLVSMRSIKLKKGDTLIIVSLDDKSARIDVAISAELAQNCRHLLNKEAILLVQGTIKHDDYTGLLSMRADQVMSLMDMRKKSIKKLKLTINVHLCQKEKVELLKQAISPYQGGDCPIQVEYIYDEFTADFSFGENWKVEPSDEMLHQVRVLLGKEAVTMSF